MLADDLFDRYAVPVYQYFLRMTGHANDAGDLTQEVFLRIVGSQHRYEPRGREAAWVFRIARNVLAKRRRSASRSPETALADAEVAYEPDRVLAIGFDEALRLLQKLDRDVYLLREQGGLTYEEVAALCGLTQDGVRARLRRTRDHIRRLVAVRLSDGTRE
jgi:RNA polymerase sigma-70 factor (ECF subfamily)